MFGRKKQDVPAPREEEAHMDFLELEDDTVYVSLNSMLDFLSVCEKVWGPEKKACLRGVRGALLESYVKSKTLTA